MAIEAPLSARNGSSIDDRDDMFEKSTLVSRMTHTRNRGLLHGAPLLCKRITTVSRVTTLPEETTHADLKPVLDARYRGTTCDSRAS